MPPFLAIFMSTDGIPIQTGLFTEGEFRARIDAAIDKTKWALLLDTADGTTVAHFTQSDAENGRRLAGLTKQKIA